jgi:TRAP-type uncharacterized transport system fused permease subunit
MRGREARFDIEETIIAFMLAFWPAVLVLGVIDHFFLTEYNLQLASLALAGAAGWANVKLQRRKAERVELIDGPG